FSDAAHECRPVAADQLFAAHDQCASSLALPDRARGSAPLRDWGNQVTMMTKMVSAFALTTMLCACAGRQPAQIGVVQAQDPSMDCLAIQAEANSNSSRIADLGRESSNKVAQNVAAGVAGLLIWPLWFAMDFQGA